MEVSVCSDRSSRLAPFGRQFVWGLFAFLLAIGSGFSSLVAAATNPINLSLDHADGVYAKGESAALTISVPSDFLGDAEWNGSVTWKRNWTGKEQPVDWPVSGKPFVLEFPDEGPALIVVTATLKAAKGGSTHKSAIGMMFQPEAIPLSSPEPEDFDEFWDNQKAEWRDRRDKVVLTPLDSGDPAVLAWDVTIHLKGKTPVSGYLARPADADPKSLPALLTLHGAGFRSAGLGGIVRSARQGFIAMDLNAHGFPNGKSADFYKETGAALGNYRARGVESPEEWYFHGMYLRVVMALDFLTEAPEWNGVDLVVNGSSQGGGQAMAGAGLDPRVTVMAASVPAMCDLSGALLGRRGGWPRAMPTKLEDPEQIGKIYRTFQYYDSGLFAKRSRAKSIVSLGLIDSTCPADGIQASINNLRYELKPLYRPAMGHAIPADIKKAFQEFILDRVTLPSQTQASSKK